VDLHHLRHFIAVAEELHFGRAARRLNMAQPPLSQSIRRLEASLGVPLFERSRRHVALTPAGTVLLVEARRTLEQADHAMRMTRRAGAGEAASLAVGFVSRALFCGLPRGVRQFREDWPGASVRLDELPSIQQVDALRRGDLDIGVLYAPIDGLQDLAVRTLERSHFVAVVPSTAGLARRRSIRLAELANEPFVVAPQAASPHLQANVLAACRHAGFSPRVAQESLHEHAMLSLVAGGIGVALMPATARSIHVDGVSFIKVSDLPSYLYSELVMAWLPQAESPALKALVASLGKAMGSRSS
jgi:DNA-binding transcriptional LysR family regulator